MFEINGVTKDFFPSFSLSDIMRLNLKRAGPVRALDGVSFSMPKGKTMAVLGPNGAGKTTLLKIISTLILPDSGTVTINGLSLGRDDDRIKACLGLVTSSERGFYWRLTGRQNLQFFAAMYGLGKAQAKKRVEDLFGLFEINYEERRFDSYSTGMQQKLAIMRALLHDPELLLLDEPTRSLDYAAAVELRLFIKNTLVKKQGKTVIFTTHHMDEAIDFADDFMVLHKGKLLARGTLESLRQKIGRTNASLGEIFISLTRGIKHD